MEKLKKVIGLIKYNIKALIGFEFLFKIISVLIFTPIFMKSFIWIMKLTGYNYLTLENVVSFLLNPLTLICLILLILLLMIYSMFDIITIITILDQSYHQHKIKVIEAISLSLSKCRNIFHIKNIPLAFLVLFLIPFLNLGISSGFISTIKIPEFIYDFIVKNHFLLTLFIILVMALIILLLRWIYALHYFVLENMPFKEACQKSRDLSKKNHLKDLVALVGVQLGISLLYFIFVIIGIVLILLFNKLFSSLTLLKSLTSSIIWGLLAISFIVVSLLSTPISYACISVMFYLHKGAKKERIKEIKVKKMDVKMPKIIKRCAIALSVIALLLGVLFTYGLYRGEYNLNIEYVRNIEVTAHRGASAMYPENTMSAFIGAKELGADWVELDVQQTKDGKIIVSHDTNLLRVTGVNKNIIDMNYEDISVLDAGSFFDKKFKDERIPLFEDVVLWAKDNNMKLNVELKPTGKEHDFEAMVIDIINEYDYASSCVITSQVYSVLENAKAYQSDITTVYVMSLAVGDIISLDKADYFSVEASNVNDALVRKVHNAGKQLYVWTINTEDTILKMIDYQVDNIITDNITLAKDTIMESKTSNVINEFIKFVEDNLK